MRAGAAGVHHPLGDALVVEVGDLLAQVVVLQQRRPARAGLQRVVGVAQPHALRGRQVIAGLRRDAAGRARGEPVGDTATGASWSGLGGSGALGVVGSALDGGSTPGTPGTRPAIGT